MKNEHADTPSYGRGRHSSGFVATDRERILNPDGSISYSNPGPYDFGIFSAYTPEYADVVQAHLLPSLRARLGEANFVRYAVHPIPSRGSWIANCGAKPTAILIHARSNGFSFPIMWVDADAEVVGDLEPLNKISREYDVAVLRPDRSMRERWPLVNSECLSGTIMFGASRPSIVEVFLAEWARRCDARPNELDQDVLGEVLREFESEHGLRVAQLPPEYVCIPDLMPDVVGRIVHRQASRRKRGEVG